MTLISLANFKRSVDFKFEEYSPKFLLHLEKSSEALPFLLAESISHSVKGKLFLSNSVEGVVILLAIF